MAYYPTFNPNYNNQVFLNDLQVMRDRIDRQMQQIQNQNTATQVPQQVPQVNQTFQLAPNRNSEIESKVVKDIEEIKSIFVTKLGIFVNEDFSKLWIKNDYGNIREFETKEIIELDEKDKTIIEMRQEIERLKEVINNDSDKSTGVATSTNANSTKQKSSNVSKSK